MKKLVFIAAVTYVLLSWIPTITCMHPWAPEL